MISFCSSPNPRLARAGFVLALIAAFGFVAGCDGGSNGDAPESAHNGPANQTSAASEDGRPTEGMSVTFADGTTLRYRSFPYGGSRVIGVAREGRILVNVVTSIGGTPKPGDERLAVYDLGIAGTEEGDYTLQPNYEIPRKPQPGVAGIHLRSTAKDDAQGQATIPADLFSQDGTLTIKKFGTRPNEHDDKIADIVELHFVFNGTFASEDGTVTRTVESGEFYGIAE